MLDAETSELLRLSRIYYCFVGMHRNEVYTTVIKLMRSIRSSKFFEAVCV